LSRREEYAELHLHTNHSFLDGASQPEAIVDRAVELGLSAVAVTDHDGLYGAVRMATAGKRAGLKVIIGAEATTAAGHHLTLLARTSQGYANLSRLLSLSQLAGSKGQARLDLDSLLPQVEGIICLSGCRQGEIASHLLAGRRSQATEATRRHIALFGRDNFFIELQNHYLPDDRHLNAELVALAQALGLKCVATNNVHYAHRRDRPLQDILVCIKNLISLDRAGKLLRPNSEYCLKSTADMATLFAEHPAAVANAAAIARECTFDLGELRYRFPSFPVPEGETPFSYLYRLCHQGALERYHPVTSTVLKQLTHELEVIERLGLAEYFLIVWDIMRYAREQGVLGQGRGSAANSVVAYVLGITNVDPIKLDLLFERFLSEDRAGLPDIDIDFASKDREKIIQYVYERYGRDHAGMVCEVITYRGRSALRDVGKAFGLTPSQVDALAKSLEHRSLAEVKPSDLDLSGELAAQVLEFSKQIEGFPRHLGIHVGGMVITARPLTEVVPIEKATMPGRTVTQWDKDDIEAAGLVKIDILGLGMLSLIQDCLKLIEADHGVKIDLSQLTYDDPAVYDMLSRADTVGVFQVESRAQMATLPRLKPRCFYDLVVEVALIRPGPIQGEMVHPYLQRRAGKEEVTYLHPSLEPVLRKTLGVPLFQEQGMRVAIVAAGFSPGKADQLRRAMGHKRSREQMEALFDDLVGGMARNGIPHEAAARIFRQLSAFADYGFPESHAASFALLVYASAYLKLYYPAEFYCALLNNQPMGFYQPAVIVGDARRHGVKILPVDVNLSHADCTVEGNAVRLGYRYVRDIGEQALTHLEREHNIGPYTSVGDFCRRTQLPRSAVENLIAIGAFDSFGRSRRRLLWELPEALREAKGALRIASTDPGPAVSDEPGTLLEAVRADYYVLGLSPSRQVVEFYRPSLEKMGVRTADELRSLEDGQAVRVAGLVVCRQAPPTAKGHVFLTIEDETGLFNVIVRPDVYEKQRRLVRSQPLLLVEGLLQKQDDALSLLAQRFHPLSKAEKTVWLQPRDFR